MSAPTTASEASKALACRDLLGLDGWMICNVVEWQTLLASVSAKAAHVGSDRWRPLSIETHGSLVTVVWTYPTMRHGKPEALLQMSGGTPIRPVIRPHALLWKIPIADWTPQELRRYQFKA